MSTQKKAKSRLNNNSFIPRRLRGTGGVEKAAEIATMVGKKSWQFLKWLAKVILKWLSGYWKYLQVLTVSLFFYAIIFLIVTRIAPGDLANIPLPDTYFLFQLPLFFGNFFFGTFLFQNKKLGLLFAAVILVILFFKFQHFLI